VFQVVRAVGGDPPDTAASNHAWLWNELAVTAPDAAARFYQTVFGYRIDLIESPGAAPYLVLSRDGQARAGIRGESDESSKSSWVPYLQVADLDAALSRVRSLGATVVAESSGAGGADAAIIVDPSGAMVALQHASDDRALALGFRGLSTQ
ncbi:MAG: VOC family protein, partial [Myxococcota bacterium]